MPDVMVLLDFLEVYDKWATKSLKIQLFLAFFFLMSSKSLLVIFENINMLALCDNMFEIMDFRYAVVGNMPL